MSLPRPAVKFTWFLDETATCTYDNTGTGTVILAPGGAKERWEIHFISVSSTQIAANKIPQMRMYRGSVNGPSLGGTFSAVNDNDTDAILLNMNEGIAFVFSGGDPTCVGTIHIEGLRYVWGT